MAVPISDELRTALRDYVGELRRASWADDWRWTDPAGWHITLAFLGSISPASVPEIAAKLEQVATRHAPFIVETGGLGAFPSPARARVLWYGVHHPAGRLEAIADEVRLALNVQQAPFRSHVTLARRRNGGRRDPASPPLIGIDSTPSGQLLVHSVDLYRSRQGPNGSRYELLSPTSFLT